MAGALTERAFVENLQQAGFGDIRVHERRTWGLAEVEGEPLLTPVLVDLMRRLIPSDMQQRIGVLLEVTVTKPLVAGQVLVSMTRTASAIDPKRSSASRLRPGA